MHIVTILGLLFALVFGLVAFGSMMSLHTDIAALTTGGFSAIASLLPTFWMLLIGAIGIGAVAVAAKWMLD